MINAITAAQNQTLGQYAAAGGLATESLGAIRTVSALNAITRYRVYLFTAMQVGIKKGFKVGLGNGLLFCVCFFTYALGFWYGGTLVADSLANGCTGNECMNGGTAAVSACIAQFTGTAHWLATAQCVDLSCSQSLTLFLL
jgi:hypothetical protein